MKPEETKEISLVGILTPLSWDNVGNPQRLALATLDEKEYTIEPEDTARQMLPRLRCLLEVVGYASSVPRGGLRIRVTGWRELKRDETTDFEVGNAEQASSRHRRPAVARKKRHNCTDS